MAYIIDNNNQQRLTKHVLIACHYLGNLSFVSFSPADALIQLSNVTSEEAPDV